jgi:tRNA A37 threonylcarbamoyladenosine biosynthesis protein TsaE
VIEWGQVIAGGIPPDHLIVEFEVAEDESRSISLVPKGSWRSRPLKELDL